MKGDSEGRVKTDSLPLPVLQLLSLCNIHIVLVADLEVFNPFVHSCEWRDLSVRAFGARAWREAYQLRSVLGDKVDKMGSFVLLRHVD
jgi:hypothetical protein